MQNSEISFHILSAPLFNSETELIEQSDANHQLPTYLIGDQIRLQQVLVNLTKNAVKFCRGKPIKIYACHDSMQQSLCI